MDMPAPAQGGFEGPASELLMKQDVLRHILYSMSDSVMILDQDGALVHASVHNPLMTVLSDTERFLDNVHPADRSDVIRTFVRVKTHCKVYTVQYQYQLAGEDWIWVESTGIPLTSNDRTACHIAVVSKDITKQKHAEESLRTMAFHDPLTGLPNRRLFKERLAQSLAQAKRSRGHLAIFYLDIDDFKRINDTMGHETGDEFLKAFAKRLKSCIREIDIVARMGGDEFTVLLPSVDSASNVEKVVRRIITSIQAPWEIRGYRFQATVSGGVVVYPVNGEDAVTLLRHVDMALYQVKGSGRNNYVFYDSLIWSGGTA